MLPKVFRVTDKTELTMNVTTFMIDEAVEYLREDGECFIAYIDSSLAWKYRKRIMKRFRDEDVKIKSTPGKRKDLVTGKKHTGYYFKLVKIQDSE